MPDIIRRTAHEMKGEQLIPAPQQVVWTRSTTRVLKPACRLRVDREERRQRVPGADGGARRPVSAKFKGKLTLSDINPPLLLDFLRGQAARDSQRQRPGEVVCRRNPYQAVL